MPKTCRWRAEATLIAIIGESCTGKTTLARHLADIWKAKIISGRDYLRLAKSEAEAKALFIRKLQQACRGGHLIYVIADPEDVVKAVEAHHAALSIAEA